MKKTPAGPVAQLVADLGGLQVVSDRLNKQPGTVRMWIFRKAVPRTVWPDLLEAYPDKLTLDKLRLVEARAA